MLKKIASWKRDWQLRKSHCTNNKLPFYDVAAKYLPSARSAAVADIGCGSGAFASHLELQEKYDNLFLLDGNEGTIDELKKRYKNAILWRSPDKLPFEDLSISFLHCSHFIEHLYHEDLYNFLIDVDRVLKESGILVISAPLLWSGFHDDLSHIKPYNKEVFINYLCKVSSSRTSNLVSEQYSQLELIYRYRELQYEDQIFWGGETFAVETVVRLLQSLLYKLGFKRYIRNGYTLVLQKQGR